MGPNSGLLYLGVFLLIISLSEAKHWKMIGRGQITCDDKPMVGVRVKLMDDDLLFDDKMGSARTDDIGEFIVHGVGKDFIRGKPDPYISIEYEGRTISGHLQIERSLHAIEKHRFPAHKYKKYIDFGKLNVGDINCRSYVQFSRALDNFRRLTGMTPPYKTLHVRTGAHVSSGRPWSSTDTIRIPKQFTDVTPYIAHHEFAYTFRDSYDGGYLHFLRDAVEFGYAQKHSCHTKTNQGFAFSEGWANFWATQAVGGHRCRRKTGYGRSLWDYRYEGNVEQVLNRIKKHCKASLFMMVKVLKNNKGKIHTLKEYRKKFRQMYKC